jgi:hypothetical protein
MHWLRFKIKRFRCSREVSQSKRKSMEDRLYSHSVCKNFRFSVLNIRSRSEVKAYKKYTYDGGGRSIYEFAFYGRSFGQSASLLSHLIFISFTLHPILIYTINNILHGPVFFLLLRQIIGFQPQTFYPVFFKFLGTE